MMLAEGNTQIKFVAVHVFLLLLLLLLLSFTAKAKCKNGCLALASYSHTMSGMVQTSLTAEIINVYNQEYESAAAFWPDVHGRVVSALVISQLLPLGLLSSKGAKASTPFLLPLPVLTIAFYKYCAGRYEPAFVRYPLKEAKMKDTLEHAREPNLNLKGYLQSAYDHPVFKECDEDEDDGEDHCSFSDKFQYDSVIVATKRQSKLNTPVQSKMTAGSTLPSPDAVEDLKP